METQVYSEKSPLKEDETSEPAGHTHTHTHTHALTHTHTHTHLTWKHRCTQRSLP